MLWLFLELDEVVCVSVKVRFSSKDMIRNGLVFVLGLV